MFNICRINPRATKSVACVASVSSRGSSRKLGQEQKKKKINNSIGNACYAGYKKCQYTQGSVFKFAWPCSQIFNRLNIVEHFAGWKFCSRLASEDVVYPWNLWFTWRSFAPGACPWSPGACRGCVGSGSCQEPIKFDGLLVVRRGLWVVRPRSCVVRRASCVVRRVVRDSSCLLEKNLARRI